MQHLRISAAEEDLDIIQNGKKPKDFSSGNYELLNTGSTTWEWKN